MREIKVIKNVLDQQIGQAFRNKQIFERNRVLTVNIMGSPGCGKTTFIETLNSRFGKEWQIAVIEGDYEGITDTERLLDQGIPTVQINVHSCHLNADFVKAALDEVNLEATDWLLIENVGNLICPASYELGEAVKLVLLSVPEGEDKPEKYPKMFSIADAILITKWDFAPFMGFSLERFTERVRKLNPEAPVFTYSNKEPETVTPVGEFLASKFEELFGSKT